MTAKKKQTATITKTLEEAFGIPQRKRGGDPLDSLVITILSQNTNDHNRDIAYQRLRQRFTGWIAVMNAKPTAIADAIRPAGLANQKSIRIKHILNWINETYGALTLDFLCDMNVQEAIDTFTQLKGIGIKTISVVLMFNCGKDIFPVDTHVHRLTRRLGLVPENVSAEKTHQLMQPLVPRGKSYSLHMNLLKLGRTICKARKPNCPMCPLRRICPTAKNMVEES